MIRESRNERKLKAIERAKFALKQRLDKIDWEEDVLLPQVEAFKSQAVLPEAPSETLVDVEVVSSDGSS